MVILSIAAFFALLNLGLAPLLDINLVLLADIAVWTAMNIWLSRLISARRSHKDAPEEMRIKNE